MLHHHHKVICRVKALYSYESTDPASLSFKADSVIDVLSQLDSGWWDGWCHGKRGWFPSNYVEIIKAPNEKQRQQPKQRTITDLTMQQQLRLSLHASDTLMASDIIMPSPLDSAWVLQTTEDGSEQYYYNKHTHEMRYSFPYPMENNESLSSLNDGTFHNGQHGMGLETPTRPARSDHRIRTESSQDSLPLLEEEEFYDDEKLPPHWVRETTAQGRFYYLNTKTLQTTWELENIDPDTGALLTCLPNTPSPPPPPPGAMDNTRLQEEPLLTLEKEECTWSHLSESIEQAVDTLHTSIRQHQPQCLSQDATRIVHHVRRLLYVTHCIEKDASVYLGSHKSLRQAHRTLLASLAKLVLATKVASGAWPAPSSLTKLDADATDVLMATRQFISTAQACRVDIRQGKPTLKTETGDEFRNNPLILKSMAHASDNNMVTSTLVLVDQVRGAMTSFMDSVKTAYDHPTTLKMHAPMLVAQFRNLSNTTSQFLNAIEHVCQAQPYQARTKALVESKQPVYVAMGGLFVASQTITSSDLDQEQLKAAYERLVQCVETIEKGLTHVMETISSDPMLHQTDPEDTIQPDVDTPQRKDKVTKLAEFFGEDTLTARLREDISTVPITNAHGLEVPWYLGSDCDPNQISFNMEGNVKGGSLHTLVQYMTQHDQLDSKFNSTFLLTYRSFCTTEQLFHELFSRYQLAAPDALTAEELGIWKEKKLKLVRLRVFNIIKSWLETYFNEEEDRPILPEISHFTEHVIVESMKFGAEQLTKLIKKRMLAEDSGQIRKMKLNVRTADMPPSILPKNMKHIKLLELDPLELARQMTIMDFKLYNRIKPVECLDKNWGKPDSENHIAANIKASIEHSNQVTAWVTDSILSKEEVKKRAVVMKHWISVAERCRTLNNFNMCMAILSAFDNGSIGRLKRTWELMSTRSMLTLQNIRRLMGAQRNFAEYRELIKKVNPPCIPFLGIYLQDLTFIEDGNSNYLKKSNNQINFAKRMKTAEVIRDLQQYQSTHYMLTAVPDIQEFIKTHLHSSREEDELYELSLKLEPRERGEDTIARRLKESGL